MYNCPRDKIFPLHKVKKSKTISALYDIEYQLEKILRKINLENLQISNDQGVMFYKFTIQKKSSDIRLVFTLSLAAA